jgi:GT2 family glycosyltransferase
MGADQGAPTGRERVWAKGGPRAAFEPGLVSVIMPTHNQAAHLRAALDSVSAQDYRPLEVLMVDDGSTDATARIFERWRRDQEGDGEVTARYLRQAKAGAPAARNRGLVASRGEYIQFMDSDDLLREGRISRMVGLLGSDEGLDYVWADAGRFRDEVSRAEPPVVPSWEVATLTDAVIADAWWTWSGLYRRRCCLALGPWDERLRANQDWEYNVRLAILGMRVRRIPEVLYWWRDHGAGTITGGVDTPGGILARVAATRAVAERIEEAGLMSREVSAALTTRCWSLTTRALRGGHGEAARGAIGEAMRLRPDPVRLLEFAGARLLCALPGRAAAELMRAAERAVAAGRRLAGVGAERGAGEHRGAAR